MKYFFFLLISVSMNVALFAQPREGGSGLALYQQGKYAEAAQSLASAVTSKTGRLDDKLWNALGLAETMLGDYKKAIKSFKKATDLNRTEAAYWTNLGYAKLRIRDLNGAQSATDQAIRLDANVALAYYVRGLAHLWEGDLDEAQKNYLEIRNRDPKFSNGYVLGSWVQLARLSNLISKKGDPGNIRDHLDSLKEAVDILQAGIDNCKACTGKEDLFSEYEGLTYIYDHYLKEPRLPGAPSEPEPGVTPIKVLSKPIAQYTDAARNSSVEGTIRIVVVLKSDGTVGHMFLLKRLGYGLDENAIRAARSIKFQPKMKDGRPVPAVMIVEYTFRVY